MKSLVSFNMLYCSWDLILLRCKSKQKSQVKNLLNRRDKFYLFSNNCKYNRRKI